MEIKKATEKAMKFIEKYKYVAIILLIGIVFMLIPNKDTKMEAEDSPDVITCEEITFEERLAEILKLIDGAGDVRVMLTISEGEEYIFQTMYGRTNYTLCK